MKALPAVFAGLYILVLAGCATPTPETPSSMPLAQPTVYKGILPCADCAGIEYILKLYRDQSGEPSHYKLMQKYLNGDTPSTSMREGRWIIRDSSRLPGHVFVLSTDAPDGPILFLHKAANALELLSPDGSRAVTDLDYTLLKQR